jgi:bifunctional non-homologous end joining protein LigD
MRDGSRAPRFEHRDRVLFPRDGITKGHLLDYYSAVAPALLPHLADRPFVSRRAPEGIDGPYFFQKDAPPGTPAWVRRAEIPAESRRGKAKESVTYPVVDDVPALRWLVNVGCIDLHVGLSRVDSYLAPDVVLFDLDPTPDTGFATVARTALRLHEALAGIGLDCLAKTSGAAGMHVVVPIETGPTFADTRRFARAVATALARVHPDETSAAFAVGRRRGVFLDWKQNSLGASIVTAYSVRPLDGAPVSCPLAWDEVTESLDPRELSMPVALERIERLGDLFAPALAGGHDLHRHLGGER